MLVIHILTDNVNPAADMCAAEVQQCVSGESAGVNKGQSVASSVYF